MNQLCILAGGILSFFMGIFHLRFYKIFNWHEEFTKIGASSQKILYTIHIALLLLFFMFAFVSFVYHDELSRAEGISYGIILFYAIFWLWRTIWQIAYFKPSKSKKLRKYLYMHYLLILWFFLLFVSYLMPVITTL